MRISTIEVDKHYHPLFQVTRGTGGHTGFISTITGHDFGNGFCLVGVPVIFTNVSWGSGHRFNRAFTPNEWVAAHRACLSLNEKVLDGRRDFTDQSVKSVFNYYNGKALEEYVEHVREAKKIALQESKENNCEVFRVWSVLVDQGVEYHVRHVNNGFRTYAAEVQSTVRYE